MTPHHPSTPESPSPADPARRSRLPFYTYLALTVALLAALLWPEGRPGNQPAQALASEAAQVQLDSDGQIRIEPGSPLNRKLEVVEVGPTHITVPLLTVTGNVVASFRPGTAGHRDWQFSTPELLTIYTDWQKAVAEIAFARTQLDSTRQLSTGRATAQEAAVQRLARLVEAGTDSEKDLAAARADLLQTQLEGRQSIHEADTFLRTAQRTEAALGRQLQQAGLDPDLLQSVTGEADIVVADVPEALIARVRRGQGCEARFIGLSDRVFPGSVRAIAPVLSQERRSLRVLFLIDDPADLLRPGMFAEVGLGTDAREGLMAPLAGVVHVGRSDIMLVRSTENRWKVTRVQAGEVHDTLVEVLQGLEPGAHVVGDGAILLKPLILEALNEDADVSRGPHRHQRGAGRPGGGRGGR